MSFRNALATIVVLAVAGGYSFSRENQEPRGGPAEIGTNTKLESDASTPQDHLILSAYLRD